MVSIHVLKLSGFLEVDGEQFYPSKNYSPHYFTGVPHLLHSDLCYMKSILISKRGSSNNGFQGGSLFEFKVEYLANCQKYNLNLEGTNCSNELEPRLERYVVNSPIHFIYLYHFQKQALV